jgi:NTE family protein
MKKMYLDIVKNIDLFSNIDDDILESMLDSFTLVDIKENDTLFQIGDQSDAFYITLSGYLVALLKNEKDELYSIGRIKTGELIGEMGILNKKPRNLTVKALSDAKLLKLTDIAFKQLISIAPDIVYQILLNIILREQNKLDTMSLISQKVIKKSNRHVLITAVNPSVDISEFLVTLKSLTQQEGYIEKFFFIDEEKLLKYYNMRGLSSLMEYIDNLEKSHHTLLYYITEKFQYLVKFLIKRADLFILVGAGLQLPNYSSFVCQLMEQHDLRDIKKELVLLWPTRTQIKNTHIWLNPADFHCHHHIIINDSGSYQRLLRFFQGKAVGLVLSGGAARGWAHVGVIRAMKEKKIPIDAICGTSSGSGVAGFHLLSNNEEELIEYVKQMRDGVNHSIAWFSVTFPAISFYNAVRATYSLKSIFEERNIENFDIPFFAVSTNVSTQTENVHRLGRVWRAIRASAAIPGFFPPLVENGQLLYDGGLMNNLPVDRMRKLLGPDATIIASDLEVSLEDKKQYYFPPTLSLTKLLLSKLGLTNQKYVFPNFFSTLLKSILLGSLQKSQDNIALANYYIHPDLSKYNMLSLEEISEKELVESGYQNALAILKDYD